MSGEDDLSKFSKEELIATIEELQNDVDELNEHIQNLEQENLKLNRRVKKQGTDNDDDMEDTLTSAALQTDNDQLREKLSQTQTEVARLKESNAELMSSVKVSQSEKVAAEAEARGLRKKLDDLEKSLAENEESMRANLRKSQDISKQKKDTQRQQLQLFEENEILQKNVGNNFRLI
jgi:predicted nuclease with TOPRIM domain